MLGDTGNSLVVGTGHNPPGYAAIQSASCPDPPAACPSAQAQLSSSPNPQTARGALIYGNFLAEDTLEDSRTDASNMAAVRVLVRS